MYGLVNGRKIRTKGHEKLQLLSAEEEKELVRWITRLTNQSYPPKPYTVREMAEAIRTRRVIGINDPSITRVSYPPIGKQWVSRFMQHHPNLDSIIAETIEAARIKETSSEVLQKWFNEIKSIIDEFDIQPQDIHNMDETGNSIGSINSTRVIVDKSQKSFYSTQPGRQE